MAIALKRRLRRHCGASQSPGADAAPGGRACTGSPDARGRRHGRRVGPRVGAGGRGSLYEIRRRRRWSSRDLDFRRVDLRHPEPPSGRRLTGQAQAHQPAAGELTVVKLSLMKRKAPTAIVHYAADAADGCYMYALSRRGSATQQCGCTVAAWCHEAREHSLMRRSRTAATQQSGRTILPGLSPNVFGI